MWGNCVYPTGILKKYLKKLELLIPTAPHTSNIFEVKNILNNTVTYYHRIRETFPNTHL